MVTMNACRAGLGASRVNTLRQSRPCQGIAPSARRLRHVCRAGGRDVVVLGSRGKIAARIVQQLLSQGYGVTADADEGRSQDLLEFASKFGLLSASERKALKLVDFDATDVDSVGLALGGRGSQRVVLVAGDSVGSMRIEDSVASAAIDAVLSSSARVSQFVLVSQLAGGGGGWFGLGGGSRGAKLSSLEQAVVDSADSALLLRTGKWSEDGGNSVPLATGRGGLPRGASVPVGIVAQGVVESLGLTSGDGVVEVGAGGSEEEGSLRDQIQRVLSTSGAAVPKSRASTATSSEEEQGTKQKGLGWSLGGKTVSSRGEPAPSGKRASTVSVRAGRGGTQSSKGTGTVKQEGSGARGWFKKAAASATGPSGAPASGSSRAEAKKLVKKLADPEEEQVKGEGGPLWGFGRKRQPKVVDAGAPGPGARRGRPGAGGRAAAKPEAEPSQGGFLDFFSKKG
ncbi:hypothetical protein APUTEX25_003450 [Auxenochlorella protothecoides]|uniref:Uncharacterized protein n=1 Tax=Auxenochlorella protothecoides TaxID=3075 RepID=A0A3M7L1D3_AUXPR|nr:hypothetical protein APUTEX25_003450 [Auxenochlorella protothecoides]|eukprot:RMZ55312.1 hypothetical protein APUTEX25_003450 [Auxenochlorella protothecoides]